MTKPFTILFALLIFFTGAFAQAKNSNFSIAGKASGFINGTTLFLYDLSNGNYRKVDSASVIDEKFFFSGKIRERYIRSAIATADLANRVSFWLAKGNISFVAEKSEFNKAIIIGSKIQADQDELNRIIDTAKNKTTAEYLFVKNNVASVVSAYVLSVYCSAWKKDSVSRLLNAFSKDIKKTSYGKKISDYLLLNRDFKIGDLVVDFMQTDISGRAVKLSDFKGKIILLEFWGSWCGPCREENPSLREIYREFQPKGFEIFGVASESDKQEWLRAVKTDSLTWTNVTDLKGSANKAAMIYGVSGYPANFLIDRNGIIIAKDFYADDLQKILTNICIQNSSK